MGKVGRCTFEMPVTGHHSNVMSDVTFTPTQSVLENQEAATVWICVVSPAIVPFGDALNRTVMIASGFFVCSRKNADRRNVECVSGNGLEGGACKVLRVADRENAEQHEKHAVTLHSIFCPPVPRDIFYSENWQPIRREKK